MLQSAPPHVPKHSQRQVQIPQKHSPWPVLHCGLQEEAAKIISVKF